MAASDFKSALATTATICTIVQFLSGVLICRKIIRKGTCGETSCFPFIVGFVACSLWLRYGCLLQDFSLIFVNSVGACLQLTYVFIYLLYSQRKALIVMQLFSVSFVLLCILAYAQYEPNAEMAKYRVGLACCSMGLLFFIAPFTVLAQVIRSKSADILPFPLIVTTFVVCCQWFVYGVLLEDPFIEIPNGLGSILSAIQLSLFVIYPKSNSGKTDKWITKEISPRTL